MSTELTDKEANDLFNQISGALKDNSVSKLDELIVNDEVKEDKPDTDVLNADDDPQDNESDDEADGNDDNVEKDPPQSDEDAEDDSGKDEPKDELAELRAQLDKLKQDKEKADKDLHHLRSQAGRMKAMSRNFAKYDEKLEELQKALTSPSNRPSTAVLEKVKGKLKTIEETDAELASVLESVLGDALDGMASDSLNREKQTLELLREQELAEYEAQEAERLISMYPNAVEVFNSPDWKEWKKSQPKGILSLAESSNADEVSTAFKLYAEAMIAKHPELANKTPPANAPDPKAKEIEEERKRKQKTSVNTTSPNAQGKIGLPDDPQALFDKFTSEIRKQITG